MVILEAAGSGVPVIAGIDCELAERMKIYEAISTIESVDDLVSSITELLNDTKKRIRQIKNAYKWLGDNCSYEVVGKQLEDIYSQIL